jgi:hypothetical protein
MAFLGNSENRVQENGNSSVIQAAHEDDSGATIRRE